MICLGTNVAIAVLSGRYPTVRNQLMDALMARPPIVISVIVLFELSYGVAKSVRPEESADALNRLLSLGISTLPFEPDDAPEAGEIRAGLERVGKPIGPYDILIAAQARRRDAILVTANQREFARVPGLRVEDWSLPTG